MRKLLLSPSTALALAALLFALSGSAFALGKKAPPFQRRCQSGAVLGIASITDEAVHGEKPFPKELSGAATLFDKRFNCTGGPVLVKKLSTGVFDLKFADNSGRAILASTSGTSGGFASWNRNSDGSFRVYISEETESGPMPKDSAFVVILF
jgi:hypothetical protein